MKKIILFLFLLTLMTSCSNSKEIDLNNSTDLDISSENNISDFDVWDIDPVYKYDDIGPISNVRTVGNNTKLFVNKDDYSIVDPIDGNIPASGVKILRNGLYGFISDKGIVITPRFTTSHEDLGPQNFLYVYDIVMGELKTDYTCEDLFSIPGWGFYNWQHYWTEDGFWCGMDGCDHYEPDEYFICDSKKISDPSLLSEFEKEKSKNIVEGIVLVTKDDWKLLDENPNDKDVIGVTNDIVILGEIKYEDLFTVKNGFYLKDGSVIWQKKCNCEFLDLEGNYIGGVYNEAYGFTEGLAAVSNGHKWGYINKNGELIIDYIFDKATPLYNGKAWVIYDGRIGKLNIQEMLDNKIPFSKEVLEVSKYELKEDNSLYIEVLVDNLRVRKGPGVEYEQIENEKVSKGYRALVLEKIEKEDYTWYRVLNHFGPDYLGHDQTDDYGANGCFEAWIADKNGEWIRELD